MTTTTLPPIQKLSIHVEPKTREFLHAVSTGGGPQIYELTVEEARNVLVKAQSGEVALLPADVEDRMIPGGELGEISIRIVRPKGRKEALPVVMYFHGGGWVLGDKFTHDRLIREIATGAEAAVVFVNFSQPPNAIFPVAIEEAYAATQWIGRNGASFNLDSSRMALAGDSVGGNMAIAVNLMTKKRGGVKIAHQVLFYPVTDASFETESYHQFAEGYFLSREAMKWFWDFYVPEEGARADSLVSPRRATVEELRGMPAALVITAEFDVLRDEGEAFAHKLAEAGVTVTASRYLGTIHDFVMLNAIASTPAARGAILQANTVLREALKKS